MRFQQIKRPVLFSLLVLCTTLLSCSLETEPYVDDIDRAREMLEQQRSRALSELEQEGNPESLKKLVELGLWEEVRSRLENADEMSDRFKLVEAQLLLKQHRYRKSEERIHEVLEQNPGNRRALLLQAELKIQSWELQDAVRIADRLLEENGRDGEAGLIRGKAALLNRNYDEARRWAGDVQEWDPEQADAYLLEAESYFWDQDPSGAEAPLVRALELNPFHPDARFSYGYAIWRRVDATQLDDMADQWNLVFEVDPLHYLTHWHFGNGHTNLTYADYADLADSLVRSRLEEADELIVRERIPEAIDVTHRVESDFPESVLPAMMRGSIYYIYYDMERSARLDSAQALFEEILERKSNYGPAHNALAAVIKQRGFEYLKGYGELQRTLDETAIPPEDDPFYDIFPDAEYYPGDRVKKMIARQIGPSKAYLPLIKKFGSDFAIPPLHRDLAEAMDRSYFRYGTTFDNRQWMDIRGVGSGATGIEYLERGAHWERNVLAHEYAHLYHGRILTDRENRRIRALYHAAMENNRALDYYASNNESEFFAQGYAGFLSRRKVHPLNHKSMNTREYIREKDPAYYAFLDSLLKKQQEYLSGNREVFDDNWAQTHLTLSQRSRSSDDPDAAAAHLDTALTYSPEYVPALLEYAEIAAGRGDFEAAEEKMAEASDLDREYAPLYVTEAHLIHKMALRDSLSFLRATEKQIPLFEKAYALENDPAEKARINRIYRERFRDYGRIADAVRTAERYVEDAPEISTYLRDRKEEAGTYANYLRSRLGYAENVTGYFKNLVDQNPQNFDYRLKYAEVLVSAGQPDIALEVLETGRRILTSAGDERADYMLLAAQIQISGEDGERADAEEMLSTIREEDLSDRETLKLAEIYLAMDRPGKAEEVLAALPEFTIPAKKAELEFVHALLAEHAGETDGAEVRYRAVLEYNPYHLRARARLIGLMRKLGKEEEAARIRDEAEHLSIAPGPGFDRMLDL